MRRPSLAEPWGKLALPAFSRVYYGKLSLPKRQALPWLRWCPIWFLRHRHGHKVVSLGVPVGWGTEWKGTRKLRAGVFGEGEEGLLRSAGRLLGAGGLSWGSAAEGPLACSQVEGVSRSTMWASKTEEGKKSGGRTLGRTWSYKEDLMPREGGREEAPLSMRRSHRWPGWGSSGGVGWNCFANYKKRQK